MTLTGTITKVFPIEVVENSKSGSTWKKAHYIVTADDAIKTQTYFEVFGEDRIKSLNLQLGQKVALEGRAESHEFNGKWYTEVHIWKCLHEQPLF